MTEVKLYGWPEEPTIPTELTPPDEKEKIVVLLRHATGATIAELMALTKCTAAQVRSAIRQIIDEGGDVEAALRTDGQQVFRLAPPLHPNVSRPTRRASQFKQGHV